MIHHLSPTMATYSPTQLNQYFTHISFPPPTSSTPRSLSLLTTLQTHQLSTIPFESLSLHYSPTRLLSLDPAALFEKFISNPSGRRGGYCMENNTFFSCVLRSLGFEVLNVGGRVSHETTGRWDNEWEGWGHMLNLVRIEGKRYLVDVGFGAEGPCKPIPLDKKEGGIILGGIGPQELRLEWKALKRHTDPQQRVWVYSYREQKKARWQEGYCFSETEFFPSDFEVMNLWVMTKRESLFVKSVIALRFVLSENAESIEGSDEDRRAEPHARASDVESEGEPKIVGVIILHDNIVKRRIQGEVEVSVVLKSEADRIAALEKYLGIRLSEKEQSCIRDLPSELREDVNEYEADRNIEQNREL